MRRELADAAGTLLRAPQRLGRLVPGRLRPRVRRAYYAAAPPRVLAPMFADALRDGARTARNEGSPLYGELLARAAADVETRGPCWEALRTFAPSAAVGDPMLASRFMAAVHRIVLEGSAPALAACYPSVGGTAPPSQAWEAFVATVAGHRDRIRELLAHPVQTNEVARCRALVGGFLHVAGTFGLPLRLLELGSSAGLNLRWDHYRYERVSGRGWGDPSSPVRLGDRYTGAPPPFEVSATVVERRGCDLAPIDPTTTAGRLALASYVRADQPERLELLDRAIAVAARVPAPVDPAEAVGWLQERLADAAEETATVVFESYVWKYLPPAGQTALVRLLDAAGRHATLRAPLALLRLGAGPDEEELELTTWPGGSTTLAVADPYGRAVRWLAAPPTPAR